MGLRNDQWPWYAILARTGREKSGSLLLENAGYDCYLPVCRLMRQWSDRRKEFEVPLFPGYFFCRMNTQNRLPVLMTPGVIQIVGVGKTPIPVEDAEIAALQSVGERGLPTMPWPYMEVGNVVRIEQGPLRGLTGIIIKIKSGMKLVLSVSLLQRSVAVDIDRSWISNAHSQVKPYEAQTERTVSVGVPPMPFDSARDVSTEQAETD